MAVRQRQRHQCRTLQTMTGVAVGAAEPKGESETEPIGAQYIRRFGTGCTYFLMNHVDLVRQYHIYNNMAFTKDLYFGRSSTL